MHVARELERERLRGRERQNKTTNIIHFTINTLKKKTGAWDPLLHALSAVQTRSPMSTEDIDTMAKVCCVFTLLLLVPPLVLVLVLLPALLPSLFFIHSIYFHSAFSSRCNHPSSLHIQTTHLFTQISTPSSLLVSSLLVPPSRLVYTFPLHFFFSTLYSR